MEQTHLKNPFIFLYKATINYFKNTKALLLSFLIFIFSILSFLFNEKLTPIIQEQANKNPSLLFLAIITNIILILIYLVVSISFILSLLKKENSLQQIFEESPRYILKIIFSSILIFILAAFIFFNLFFILGLIFSIISIVAKLGANLQFPTYFFIILFIIFTFFAFPLLFSPIFIITERERILRSISKSYYFAFKNKFLIFSSLIIFLLIFSAIFYLIFQFTPLKYSFLKILTQTYEKDLEFQYLVLIYFLENILFFPILISIYSTYFENFKEKLKEERDLDEKIKATSRKILKILLIFVILDVIFFAITLALIKYFLPKFQEQLKNLNLQDIKTNQIPK
jgi:hypothetical protein